MATQRLGLGLTDKQMELLIQKLDPKKTGGISSELFCVWLEVDSQKRQQEAADDRQTPPPAVKISSLDGGSDRCAESSRVRRFELLVNEQLEKERVRSPEIPESSRRLASAARKNSPKVWERENKQRGDRRWIESMSPLRRCRDA